MKSLKVIGIIVLILIIVILVIVCAVLIFLFFAPSVGKLPDESDKESFSSKNKLFYDGKFHNENDVTTMSSGTPYSSSRKKPETMIAASDPGLIENPEDGDLTFTWIGHSSFLLQMGRSNILVDPVMSDHSSPVGFAGPKRFSELPWTTDELPDIDVLFISHDHYDHLDYKTIKAIKDKVGKVIVPLGVDTILKGWASTRARSRYLTGGRAPPSTELPIRLPRPSISRAVTRSRATAPSGADCIYTTDITRSTTPVTAATTTSSAVSARLWARRIS